MAGLRSRFRTSRLARKSYMYAILVAATIWACMEIRSLMQEPDEPDLSQSLSSSSNANRKLLSGGVEIIPGFTGAKCGSNYYYKAPNSSEVKVKKSDWEKCPESGGTGICADPSAYAQWEADSGGIVYVIASIYLFLGVAIICDGHFTDSLDMICSKYGLNLSPDVAGATFMAAGSSAPELATSFLGVFVAKSAVGLGTILGSAVFNILIIIGSVAILTGKPLDLDYKPVVRDNFFYAISVILLCVLLAVDDQANLIDTIILLVWYGLYVLFLAYNDFLMGKIFGEDEEDADLDDIAELESPRLDMGTVQVEEPEAPPANKVIEDVAAASVVDAAAESEDATQPSEEPGEAAEAPANAEEGPKNEDGSQPANGTGSGNGTTDDTSTKEPETEMQSQADDKKAEPAENDSCIDKDKPEEKSKKRTPSFSTQRWKQDDGEKKDDDEDEEEKGIADKILDVFSCPYEFIFNYTMPNCHLELDEDEEEKWEKEYEAADKEGKAKMMKEAMDELTPGQRWFWATFFISLIHITWLSFFMVEFMLKLGCLWGIPDVVMGLTFLAMGTSIPDALGSVAVAKDGEGDMAVSNAVGSNVFDICMGLGLPWFIKLCIEAGDDCNYIYIYQASKDVIPSIIILLSIIIVLFAVFVVGKWTLYPQSGYVLYAAYGLFIIYQLLNTYVINKDQEACGPSDDKCC